MTPRADAIGLGRVEDLDPLIDRIGDARYALLEEASHGTADFYRWRAEITKRLIVERGFSFVAVEGDWPDCHRLHCCVAGGRGDPEAVLSGFDRWPRWMWANDDVVEFARWLTAYNAARFGDRPVGFHGLDVYSLWDSLREILGYLREHQPGQVETALSAMRCFEPFAEDPHDYAYSTRLVPENCERDVLRLLASMRETDEVPGLDPAFVARQNAEIVAGAERYYRTMVRGDVESWNLRDEHMTDTLDRLTQAYGPSAKAVVWAHNTHIGDARATDMAAAGMLNVGQLVRERHPEESFAVGFGTHRGTVMAGSHWGAPPETCRCRPRGRTASSHCSTRPCLMPTHCSYLRKPASGRGRCVATGPSAWCTTRREKSSETTSPPGWTAATTHSCSATSPVRWYHYTHQSEPPDNDTATRQRKQQPPEPPLSRNPIPSQIGCRAARSRYSFPP
ncbi:erythromycin esterase family protein [Amycolatopsis thermalba]|uniref:Erythromycin esterase family protein n=1 Tax=Amycolatopsis thermalba TaxID=944492 RepID=A0ABY4P3N3_9PSEU|nr:erythromycin esterase family protein [Amycolatopsis ruanii]UQS26929.1 erythromycin esterase family protein [Amycolatopsis thermalba]